MKCYRCGEMVTSGSVLCAECRAELAAMARAAEECEALRGVCAAMLKKAEELAQNSSGIMARTAAKRVLCEMRAVYEEAGR